jgi:hypothetical protein
MKPSNQLGVKTAILVTYGLLLLGIFVTLYKSEWNCASVFTGLLVSFTIFLLIKGEHWEKLRVGLSGIEITKNLKDVARDAKKVKVSKKAEKQATEILNNIRKSKAPNLEFIGLCIEMEKTLRELGQEVGLSEEFNRRPFRDLKITLEKKGILTGWLLAALNILGNYRDLAVHGSILTMEEYNIVINIAKKTLAELHDLINKHITAMEAKADYYISR